jgi:uncharacterized protein (UPF0548 family)
MLLFSKPTPEEIREFVAGLQHEKFSYGEVGASRGRAPNGFTEDHHRIQLGEGLETFERAKRALHAWRMFDMPWLALFWPTAPVEVGTDVAVLVSHLGFWSLNACRIAYVVDEQGAIASHGFAYGTLREHAEIGEERFTVEFHPANQSVWYDIYAFSRPRLMALVAYPFTRALQKRFARDSMQVMLAAVNQA